MIQIIEKVAKIVGGVEALAGKLGVSRQAIYQWRNVPPERVLALEAITGGAVSRSELRADLYPPGDYPRSAAPTAPLGAGQ